MAARAGEPDGLAFGLSGTMHNAQCKMHNEHVPLMHRYSDAHRHVSRPVP